MPKAAVDALNQCPQLNAQVDESDIVYHNYCDIGIAIGSGKGLVVDYYGHYEKSQSAHEAIDAYIADHGYAAQEFVIEEYVSGPPTESDPSKWHTRITYVITD